MKRRFMAVVLSVMFLVGCFKTDIDAASEEDLLALAVEAVAAGESYTVAVSVAAVLLNRVKADEYPSALAAVIADAGMDISSVTPSDRSRRAARDACLGFDPTDGALGYSKDSSPPFVRLKTGAWSFY